MGNPRSRLFHSVLGILVFLVVVAGQALVLGFCYERITQRTNENLGMAGLLVAWSILAYFPARLAFNAIRMRGSALSWHCTKCGYDLRGNESGICPECGKPIEEDIQRLLSVIDAGIHDIATWRARSFKRKLRGVTAVVGVVMLALLGYILTRSDEPLELPPEWDPARCKIDLVEWSDSSGMKDLEPNVVFAVGRSGVLVKLLFQSGARATLNAVEVWESPGRPWFVADLTTHGYTVHSYSGLGQAAKEPAITYIDTDGDYVLDRKHEWPSGAVSCADVSVAWHACN